MRNKSKYFLLSMFIFYAIILLYSTAVFADDVTLVWDAPIDNEDGTPLTDLAGFNVYYGTQSRGGAVYPSEFSYDSVEGAGNVTSYQINNLTDGLTYYFSITAVNASGNESRFSDELSLTLSLPFPVPDIVVSDSISPAGDYQIPFGDVTVGSPLQQHVTITNNGNADLMIGNIAQNNPVVLPFSILNDSCSGQSIAPSSNCTLTVRFAPYSTGSLNDSFDIPSDDPDEGTVTLSVSGTGLSMPVPDIRVNDSVVPVSDQQIPFGEVTEGSVSQQNITIANNGNADLVIGTISQSNPIALPFGILNDYCSGQSISPSSNCTLIVSFSPLSSGSFNNSFDIPSDDPDENPVIVTVNGTGLSSVVNNPPSEPALVFPAHGQRGLGKKVGMKWKKSKDPDGDLVTYDVHICSDESLTTDCTTGTNILSLLNTNIYYAGVGMYGIGFLFVGMIVTFLYGSNNKKNLALLAASVLIATILLISCGGGGSGGVSGAVISSEYTGDEISYSVDLEAGTTYYWKVVAEDGNGGEASSEVRSFETL